MYGFALEHYTHWREALSNPELGPGAFGENLTMTELDEEKICIGDHWSAGQSLAALVVRIAEMLGERGASMAAESLLVFGLFATLAAIWLVRASVQSCLKFHPVVCCSLCVTLAWFILVYVLCRWGAAWGDGGYYYLWRSKEYTCGIGNMVAYVV